MVIAQNNVYLSVIMPVYNEEDVISESIKKMLQVLNSSRVNYELIVVDDGSTDHSRDIIEMYSDRIHFLHYERNSGKGYALKYGVHHSKGSHVIFVNSDLDLNPSNVIKYVNIAVKENKDVVIGSKWARGSSVSYSLTRTILSLLFHLYTKILLNIKVKDSQAGLKIFKRDVLDSIIGEVEAKGYAFDVEVLLLAEKKGYSIHELPLFSDQATRHSKISVKAIEVMFIEVWKIYLRNSKNRLIRSINEYRIDKSKSI